MSPLRLDALEPLFFTPLAVFSLPDAAALNARLLDEAFALRASSDGQQRSNQNGWHSADDFFERTEPGCRALQTHFLEAVRQATLRISPGFDFAAMAAQAQGWININGKGGFNTPHDHPGWAWSGCYYVRVPEGTTERSGCIELLDNRTNLQVPTIKDAPCFTSKYTIKPVDGMLLLFPSWLRHWVYPNEDDIERVTIAVNARFVPR
ncbi:MAG TPA: TIGR02466 family protein [Azonexus sp.]|nr:TIGR02466 family protein [Azonexus sp.]